MLSALNVEKADDFGKLLSAVARKPTPEYDDIQRLRQSLYRQGKVDRRQAAEIVHINRLLRAHNDDWTEFYLESLISFFLEYQRNKAFLSGESETILFSWLGKAVTVTDLSERRLLARLLLKIEAASERLEGEVLDAVEENLLRHEMRWSDKTPRVAGVIDEIDLQLVRRLIIGDNEYLCKKVSPIGVRFLLNLDAKIEQFAEPEHWRRLLIESLARQ